MLTQNAKDGFNELLGVCLNESLKSTEYTDWTIKNIDNKSINENEVFMLTISSNHFRLFLILHFSQNEIMNNFVAKLLKVEADKLDLKRFYDYLGEIGNGFCGIYKRELGKYFPFLGMSTPNLMVSDSLEHISIWEHEYETHCQVKSSGNVQFCGSLYLSTFDDVDFKYITNSLDDDVDSGELEFF